MKSENTNQFNEPFPAGGANGPGPDDTMAVVRLRGLRKDFEEAERRAPCSLAST